MRQSLFTVLLALGLSTSVGAANIVIQNDDGANEGFNDPNPPTNANQVGNNPGTTLGELRLNLFNAAKDVWEDILDSNQTITISAQFSELACSNNSGTLGSAGATANVANFPGSQANTAYPIALAESIAGANLNGSNPEISANFNSLVDSDPGCLGGGGFYYGLDGNAPDGTTSLFSVVLHELGHGLGFASLTSSTGQFLGAGGNPDIFSRNLFDQETNERWDEMTDAEREASSLNDPDLVWIGPRVTADRDQYLDGAPDLIVNSPPGIAGTYPVTLGEEPTILLDATGVTGEVVDGDTLSIACAEDNAAYAGKIPLFTADNGCPGSFRGFYGQISGALGVIVSNDMASGDADVSGQIGNQEVTIPYVGTTMALGDDLRANLPGANVTLRRSTTRFTGENDGRVRMYAPAVFESGSSVSHWSSSASPDLLMEPRLGEITFDQTDLTVAAFEDLGWGLVPADPPSLFKDGFEDP